MGGWEGWVRCDVGGAVLQWGKQPLHIASGEGHVDVASLLIEKGAPLDVAGKVSGLVGEGGKGTRGAQSDHTMHTQGGAWGGDGGGEAQWHC